MDASEDMADPLYEVGHNLYRRTLFGLSRWLLQEYSARAVSW